MSEKNDGGAAFPLLKVWDNEKREYADCTTSEGMSLRDYFATAAMQGMAAREICGTPVERAEAAYAVADAMIAERTK